MHKSIGVAAAFAAMWLWAGGAHAASFDCKKAASRIEHMICDDPATNALDSQIEGAYLGALDRSNHPADVTERQRAWLKQRDACTDARCLTAAYERQIPLLSNLSDEPAVCPGDTTIEMDRCGAQHSRRADRELARYVAAARKRLLDEANSGEDGRTAKMALAGFDAAQAAWTSFRKAECGAVYDWWSEGTIRGAMFQGCWLSVTKSRTTDVWESWLGFMDDTPPLMPKPSQK